MSMSVGMIDAYTTYGSSISPAAEATGSVQGAMEAGKLVLNPGESTQVNPGKKSSPAECVTCKNRKYQDGSDEMVSFKSAEHVSPEASGAAVRAHEAEHVSNAYKDAAQHNGKVLSAYVRIQTAVCPECGRVYTAGGTTTTKIAYSKDDGSTKGKNHDSTI